MQEAGERTLPYLRLKNQVLEDISSGRLTAHQKLPPIRQLAEDAGISLATATRAVRELCREGYLVAQSRKGVFIAEEQRTRDRTVALLVPYSEKEATSGPRLSGITAAIQSELLRHDYRMLTTVALRGDLHSYRATPMDEIAALPAGSLLCLGLLDLRYLASLADLGLPVIATDVDASDLGVHSVFFDNLRSSFDLTRCLIARGHRRIAFLGGPLFHGTEPERHQYDMAVRQRADGYRLAMAGAGLSGDLVFHTRRLRGPKAYAAALGELLAHGGEITAVVTEALHLVERELASAGRVGIATAGWCDEPQAGPPCRAAAAIADHAAMGRAAARMLHGVLQEPGGPIGREAILLDIQVSQTGEVSHA